MCSSKLPKAGGNKDPLQAIVGEYQAPFFTTPDVTEAAYHYIPTTGNSVQVPPQRIPYTLPTGSRMPGPYDAGAQEEVFKCLAKAGLTLQGKKCHLSLTVVSYLAHIFSGTGMSLDPKKVHAVKEWPSQQLSAQKMEGMLC